MAIRSGLGSKIRPAVLAVLIAALCCAINFSGCSWFKKEKAESGKSNQKVEEEPTRCPLCGRVVEDPSVLNRHPVAIKVENEPEARPQSGLDRACIVYEETTEGGITRFMPIFLCRDVDIVGPVRSARPADIELVFPYQALFAHCGGGMPTLNLIKRSGILDIDEMGWEGAYWRIRERRAPHNLYTSTGRIRQAGDTVYPFEGEVTSPFIFLTDEQQEQMEKDYTEERQRASAGQASQPGQNEYQPLVTVVNNIYIPYTSVCAVQYKYDPESRTFLRFVANYPHTDLTNGHQLTVDTVILQYIIEGRSGIKDVKGAESPELGVLGSGRALVFMLGQAIDANWEKSSREEHTKYLDNSGNEIPIKPDSTWVELVPTNKQATFD